MFCFYYYYPRKVSFELTKEIAKPNIGFDRTYYLGFDYTKNEEKLIFYLVDYYKKLSCIKASLKGYDSVFVQNIGKELDFNRYDYLITYQKKLTSLTYSPYLAKKKDCMNYLPERPLIPTFDTIITDKIYIYRIKKNNKYRAPGP